VTTSRRLLLAPRLVGLAALFAAAATISCTPPPPPAPFQIYVKVESDPGRPMQGAAISRGEKQLGTTNAEGRALVAIGGTEGAVIDVLVRCPEGYASPRAAVAVRLTRLADKKKIPEYSVACPPNMRKIVVAVRAENGAQLPVLYLQKPIATTDESGAAHFALDVPPGAPFQVQLDTSGRKDLKPPSPGKVFLVAQQDEIFVFDQRFEVERKPVYAAPRPKLPVPLRRN
jgi:hypothetical protein